MNVLRPHVIKQYDRDSNVRFFLALRPAIFLLIVPLPNSYCLERNEMGLKGVGKDGKNRMGWGRTEWGGTE